jgi:hypothetical protein
MQRLPMCERRVEISIFRTMRELKKLQEEGERLDFPAGLRIVCVVD